MFIEDVVLFDFVQCYTLKNMVENVLNLNCKKFKLFFLFCFKLLTSFLLFNTANTIYRCVIVILFLSASSLLLKEKNVSVKSIFLFLTIGYLLQNGTIILLFNNSKLQLYKLINPAIYTVISCLIFLLYKNLFEGIKILLYKKKIINNFEYQTKIKLFEKEIEVKSFLDSGNSLYSCNDVPIILLNIFECKELFEDEIYNSILLKQNEKLDKNIFFTINAKTICGTSSLICFCPSEISVNNKQIEEKVCVAVTNSNLNKSVKCGCLLHPKIFLGWV